MLSIFIGFIAFVGFFLLQACAAHTAVAPQATKTNPYQLDLPGPTLASREASGYELKNRHVSVVIGDKTGDVVYWGSIDGSQNAALWAGDSSRLPALRVFIDQIVAPSTEPATQPVMALPGAFELSNSDGYVEARDDQTWQYLGEDIEHQIGWRKIYCLDGDHLNVSMLVQNRRKVPVTIQLALGDSAVPPKRAWVSSEIFETEAYQFILHLQAYNEFHGVAARPPYFLLSDVHTLKPDERISWTMQWILRPGPWRS
jgi:hypothetical protein